MCSPKIRRLRSIEPVPSRASTGVSLSKSKRAHGADEHPGLALELAVDHDLASGSNQTLLSRSRGCGSSRRIWRNSLQNLEDLARLDGIEDVGDLLVGHGAVERGLRFLARRKMRERVAHGLDGHVTLAQESQLTTGMLDHGRADQQSETPAPHGLLEIAAGP